MGVRDPAGRASGRWAAAGIDGTVPEDLMVNVRHEPRLSARRLGGAAVIAAALLGAAACSRNPETFVQNGDRYFEQQQYEQAIVEYQNALKLNPQIGHARTRLAESYRATNQTEAAIGEFIRAADLLPDDIDVQLIAIRAFLAAGRFEDAKTRAEQVLLTDPKNAAAQRLLGGALIGLRDLDAALREIQEAIDLDPTRANAQATLAAINITRGDRDAAEAAFKKAVELDTTSADSRLLLANFYWWVGRLDAAEQTFRDAIAMRPADATTNHAMALFYVATGRPALAEPFLKARADASKDARPRLELADYYAAVNKRALALQLLETMMREPDADGGARWRAASLYYAAGKPAEAHRTIDALLAADPENGQALLVKATFLLRERKLDEALARARTAVQADPRLVPAHYAIGTILREQNHTDEAIAAFNEVLRLNPRAAAAEVALAQLHLLKDRPTEAAKYAEDAIKSQPNNLAARLTLVANYVAARDAAKAQAALAPLLATAGSDARVQGLRGAVFLLENRTAEARRAFEEALRLEPTSIDALAGLVSLDVSAKQIAAARARVDARLAKSPADPALLALAAQVQAAAGDNAAAVRLWQRVIEVDPDNLRGYEMLGRFYMGQNQLEPARAQFEALATRQPNNVGAHTMVALLLGAQNRQAEAQRRYERILEIEPRAAVAANNLAWLYADGDGSLDRALELAQMARSVMPDSPAIAHTLAWVYYKKNLPASAIPLLKRTIEQTPQEPTYHYHLGLAYEKSGDRVQARQSIERALRLNPRFPGADDARRVLGTL
jgi:putative PEP-CTERM system TPR-repeat lipoprotein